MVIWVGGSFPKHRVSIFNSALWVGSAGDPTLGVSQQRRESLLVWSLNRSTGISTTRDSSEMVRKFLLFAGA